MTAVSSLSALGEYDVTTLAFDELERFDGDELGVGFPQPYANAGVRFTASFVDGQSELASASGRVAVRSAAIVPGTHENALWLEFDLPQAAIGFYYKDELATEVRVVARDARSNILEEATFSAGEGFAGIVRVEGDIAMLEILAANASHEDATESRLFIDDLTFGRTQRRSTSIRAEARATSTPGHEHEIGAYLTRELGGIVDENLREQARKLAQALLAV